MFGNIESFEFYIRASQWIQAEGVRFIIESNRRKAFHNSGCIIWQMNEPWPNIACTSLTTYYGEQKMAYYWVKKAYKAFHCSLDYRKLKYSPNETVRGEVFLASDWFIKKESVNVICEVFASDGRKLYEKSNFIDTAPNGATSCFTLEFPAPDKSDELFMIRLRAESAINSDINEYFFSTSTGPVYRPAVFLPKTILKVLLEDQNGDVLTYSVTNEGQSLALLVQAVEKADQMNIISEDGGFSLLPGETRQVRLHFSKKFRFGFDEYNFLPDNPVPNVIFQAFNS
jgi:beta-mannosidase